MANPFLVEFLPQRDTTAFDILFDLQEYLDELAEDTIWDEYNRQMARYLSSCMQDGIDSLSGIDDPSGFTFTAEFFGHEEYVLLRVIKRLAAASTCGDPVMVEHSGDATPLVKLAKEHFGDRFVTVLFEVSHVFFYPVWIAALDDDGNRVGYFVRFSGDDEIAESLEVKHSDVPR